MFDLKICGYAELGAENERTAILNSLKGNSPTIGVFVEPQRGANAVAIADEFYRRLKELRKEIPADYQLTIGKDFTEPIRDSDFRSRRNAVRGLRAGDSDSVPFPARLALDNHSGGGDSGVHRVGVFHHVRGWLFNQHPDIV